MPAPFLDRQERLFFDRIEVRRKIRCDRSAVCAFVSPAVSLVNRWRQVVHVGERPATAAELGTAPREFANYPNRMSPAGIPMFYGAFDEPTAVIETYDPSRTGDREIALARFATLRPLRVLDLTALPEMPSQFDPSNRGKRLPLKFLRSFGREIARPVARDDGAHTEYVPTQIVTEFVRHRLRT